jgi:hypothetical protein
MQGARPSLQRSELLPGHFRPGKIKLPVLIKKTLLFFLSGEGRNKFGNAIELFQVGFRGVD